MQKPEGSAADRHTVTHELREGWFSCVVIRLSRKLAGFFGLTVVPYLHG